MSIRPPSPVFSREEIEEVSQILEAADQAEEEEMKASAQKVQQLSFELTQEGALSSEIGKRRREPASPTRSVRHKSSSGMPFQIVLPAYLKPFNGNLHRDIMSQLGFCELTSPPRRPLTRLSIHRLDQEFVNLHIQWAEFISAVFIGKNRGLPFKPFHIEIGPDDLKTVNGFAKKIVDLQFLTNKGSFFNVYLCTDSEGKKWVLKLYKHQNINELVNVITAQFLRYATFMQDDKLRPHMITHWNFQGHLKNVNGFLKTESSEEKFKQFKQYVRDVISVPFLFCPYIEGGKFPLEFSRESSHWNTLRGIFERFQELGLGNELKRSGTRIVEGTPLMIHLAPCDELDPPEMTWEESVSSFSPDPEVQRWIFPLEQR